MTIVECDDAQAEAWDAYVAGCPTASFYHLWAWRALNRLEFGHRTWAYAAMDGARIVGVFPVTQLKTLLFGRLACSMPFVNYGGPAADSPAIDAALLAEAERQSVRDKLKYLEVRSIRLLPGDYPVTSHKISLTVDVPADADEMWKGFHTSHRQAIRKAQKAGFESRQGGRELLNDFYAVLEESWRDLGTPFYDKRYFERLFDALGSRLAITVVYLDGEVAAAEMHGHFRDTGEGLWLGMRDKFRRLYVGYVLYWEILRRAAERGIRTFHLGRSTADSGAEAFKKKWNAYPKPLYWYYCGLQGRPMPALNVSNPKYQRAIALWRKLPLNVTREIGPPIARGIP
jgi:FemAB-related protein (PEP-CTERM system-associated)